LHKISSISNFRQSVASDQQPEARDQPTPENAYAKPDEELDLLLAAAYRVLPVDLYPVCPSLTGRTPII
jgi:hypothetical protein